VPKNAQSTKRTDSMLKIYIEDNNTFLIGNDVVSIVIDDNL